MREIKNGDVIDSPATSNEDRMEVNELKDMLIRRMIKAKRRYDILDRLTN